MQCIIYYGNIFYYTFNILITYYKYQYSIFIYPVKLKKLDFSKRRAFILKRKKYLHISTSMTAVSPATTIHQVR